MMESLDLTFNDFVIKYPKTTLKQIFQYYIKFLENRLRDYKLVLSKNVYREFEINESYRECESFLKDVEYFFHKDEYSYIWRAENDNYTDLEEIDYLYRLSEICNAALIHFVTFVVDLVNGGYVSGKSADKLFYSFTNIKNFSIMTLDKSNLLFTKDDLIDDLEIKTSHPYNVRDFTDKLFSLIEFYFIEFGESNFSSPKDDVFEDLIFILEPHKNQYIGECYYKNTDNKLFSVAVRNV